MQLSASPSRPLPAILFISFSCSLLEIVYKEGFGAASASERSANSRSTCE